MNNTIFTAETAPEKSRPLLEEAKFKGLTGQSAIAGHNVRLLVPTTFMNLSGHSVAALMNFYKIEPESVLVAHDELDIEPGTVRLKVGGGHGGHNGLRDIISCLGNERNFGRLRIGIGHPGSAKQVSNYVLRKAPATEKMLIEAALDDYKADLESMDARIQMRFSFPMKICLVSGCFPMGYESRSENSPYATSFFENC